MILVAWAPVGFGSVHAGTWHGTAIAIKIPKERCQNLQALPALRNELRILRYVRHHLVVLFYGARIEPESNKLALVFEKVNGKPRKVFIDMPLMPPEAPGRYQIILDICRALRYFHAQAPRIFHGGLNHLNVRIEIWHQRHAQSNWTSA